MKGFYKGLVAFAFVAAATTSVAQAQVGFNVGGGLSMPLGDFGDIADMGFHGMAGVAFQPASLPVGIRIDGMYSMFGGSEDAFGDADVGTRIISGTANAVYMFQTSEMSTFHPYLVGGLGLYNTGLTGDDVPDILDETSTDFGINAGAGFNFAAGESINLFVEGRFHNIFADESVNLIPITVGLRFGS